MKPAPLSVSKCRPSRGARGFSLVEVLVASAMMVAVFVPLAFVFTQSIRQTEVSMDELVATTAADELLDQVAVTPLVRHFPALVAYPQPNPPPAYSRWASVPTTGANLPVAAPGFTGTAPAFAPYAGNDTPADHVPYTRLYLSATPARFRRELKVHRTLDRAGTLEESEHLAEVEVRVSFDDQFVSGPRTPREVAMRAIVADPRLAGAAR